MCLYCNFSRFLALVEVGLELSVIRQTMETLRPVSSSKGDAGPGDLEVWESIANDLSDTLENILWKDCITVPYRFLFCFHCL